MSWIRAVLNETKESEAPERYFYWSAMASIAAVMRKNVWINRYYYKLFPNIYVFIVSQRSGLRKGVPISMAERLVSEVDCTRIISGRNSIQGVVKELATQRTTESGQVFDQAEGLLVAAEFVSFLVDDPDAMNILTDLHDTHAHLKGWKNTLKHSPIEALKGPCLTSLFASNEALLVNGIKSKDIEGGFMARTFVVYESKKRLSNDLLDPPEIIPNYVKLSAYLKEISKLQGEFTIDDKAKEVYRPFYKELEEREDDKTGTIDRLGDQVLKAAMLISLARSPDLIITKKDMVEAIEKSTECIGGIKRVSLGQGKSALAGQMKMVLDLILRAPGYEISRQKLLQKGWGDYDSIDLDRIIEGLSQSGIDGTPALESFRGPGKTGIVYRMPAKIAEEFSKHFEQVKKEIQ